MSQIKSLNATQLRNFCEQAEFTFTSTKEIPDFDGIVGQDRAIDALSFAIAMNQPGYNMYLMGSNGLGKHTLLKQFLDKANAECTAVDDWCYVFNFDEPDVPRAISLPAGQGLKFKNDMLQFINELDVALVGLFKLTNEKEFQKQVQDTVKNFIDKLKDSYQKINSVLSYLESLQKEITSSLTAFCMSDDSHLAYEECVGFLAFQNYEVNLFVKHTSPEHPPIIFEDDPTILNLFGQVEYVSQMGSLVTDYHYIKAGSMHKANGGYLIVDADKLFMEAPTVWQTFKRAIKNQEIKIPSSDPNAQNAFLVSMQPEPIPLDTKIILIGSRSIYNQLVDNDDDFSELFKVEVDFSETIDCSKESLNQYAQVIATLIRKNNLLEFSQTAVKAVIEYGMRQIEDTTQLSTHMHSILELLIESDYWAKEKKQTMVRDDDVKLAVEKQIYRADRSRENIYDEINKGTIFIDVTGEKVATVNGLFVIESGRLEFAQPARITANVRIGDGDIIDIEREVDLGGALHSKGVLILSSYLGSRYATNKPLSLSASLVFEQSYGSVDGDSATVGELCTLLSAIAKVPVKQSFAITGSADQHGHVQAVGGINEKIEGFFDICKLKGFTNEQGVILPAANIPHLILREDVVEAIENNQFFLYPVHTVDEAISLLTGLTAGERNSEGDFPEESLNFKVEQRLLELAALKHDDQHKDDCDENEEDKEPKNEK